MTDGPKKARHMPGPWRHQFYEGSRVERNHLVPVDKWDILAPDGTAILSAHGGSHRHLQNARLIAAAPCLLEALDYLLEQTVDMDLKYGITPSEGEDDARRRALEAIAKARGESEEAAA